jgi:hypothetical protein
LQQKLYDEIKLFLESEKVMKTYICPVPGFWAFIASELISFWKVNLKEAGPQPPYIILSGWNYSDDVDRMETWMNCIKWAEERNCTHLIPQIPENSWYQQETLSRFKSFEDFGIYNKFHKPSKKLTKEERVHHFNILRSKWVTNFGTDYFPKRLTGKKCKRLIVKSNEIKTLQVNQNVQLNITVSAVNQLMDGHTIYEIDFKR